MLPMYVLKATGKDSRAGTGTRVYIEHCDTGQWSIDRDIREQVRVQSRGKGLREAKDKQAARQMHGPGHRHLSNTAAVRNAQASLTGASFRDH
jgi:hypothetical protein